MLLPHYSLFAQLVVLAAWVVVIKVRDSQPRPPSALRATRRVHCTTQTELIHDRV